MSKSLSDSGHDLKLLGRNLLVDIAASDPHDVAQAMLKLRDTIVLLLEEATVNKTDGIPTNATRRAHQIVADLDAGELLWPGWKTKEKA